MQTIKTATGKEFKCDSLSSIPEPFRVYVRVTDATVAQVASVFSDPEETRLLEYGGITLTGCTKLLAIIPEGTTIRVNLTKGE